MFLVVVATRIAFAQHASPDPTRSKTVTVLSNIAIIVLGQEPVLDEGSNSRVHYLWRGLPGMLWMNVNRRYYTNMHLVNTRRLL
jgi:hypothetical protein